MKDKILSIAKDLARMQLVGYTVPFNRDHIVERLNKLAEAIEEEGNKNSATAIGYTEPASQSDLLAEIVNLFGEDCGCGNYGYDVECDRDGTPIQIQCEFCYANERSKFNLELKLKELLSKQTV